jgi:tRNA(His) 5'-end guanylyltransferase
MTTLAERMKRYEHVEKRVLPKRTYTLVRIDGKAFHSYTRGLVRPFDNDLAAAMDQTAVALCKELAGAKLAYVQSDEISLLLTDFAEHATEPWMAGVLQKVVSISASVATARFNLAHFAKTDSLALFDSRAWTISDPNEVANYFVWRQRDAVKNSISMTAQALFSHRRLQGLNTDQMQELMFTEKGVNWNDTPTGFKRGRVVERESFTMRDGTERSQWVAEPAPHFTVEPNSWLVDIIPRMPKLP